MSLEDPALLVTTLKNDADRALSRADPRLARVLFERATGLAPDRIDLWMGLAASLRALGEQEASLVAVERALAVDPRLFPALLMKGSLLESLGRTRPAAVAYGAAVKLAPPPATLSESTGRALAHANAVHQARAADLAAALKSAAGLDEGLKDTALGRRADIFVEALVGRRRIFNQEPVKLNFPGLPAIEFYERDEFPFLAELEALTGEMRSELLLVWAPGSAGLSPYIQYPPGVPVDQWSELNHSLDWSAFHFWLYGERVEANCQLCPRTVAALDLIDMPRVPGRSPAAMYSILRPRTRIQPHTGVANTRLVL
ncbi:MAG: aspartyl/asparaginyl beta-hydroxylase domain-containing protein, partial [Caulobacteraceae bacterium]